MLQIAHRGYSFKYKDNNLKSFIEAINNNFDVIEMDLQLNKNNEIVIYHDLFYKDKMIRNLSNNKIKKYNILTLKDFFKYFDYINVKIIFDLKGDSLLSKYLLEFINLYNIDTSNIIFASFNENHLLQLKNKKFKLGFITCNNFNSIHFFKLIKDYDFIIADINVIDENFVTQCKKYNKKLYCFTCHNENEKKLFFKYNIDGIITNIKIF
jgi:glycerophosphoryl diester phosphodiesterase